MRYSASGWRWRTAEMEKMGIPTIKEHCPGCGRCVAACPFGALSLETEKPNGFGRKRAVINSRLCTCCLICLHACPHQAIIETPDLDPECR